MGGVLVSCQIGFQFFTAPGRAIRHSAVVCSLLNHSLISFASREIAKIDSSSRRDWTSRAPGSGAEDAVGMCWYTFFACVTCNDKCNSHKPLDDSRVAPDAAAAARREDKD